ncbi:MAG: hypothetical protein AAGI90_06950 [Chlamydiota bacterium]
MDCSNHCCCVLFICEIGGYSPLCIPFLTGCTEITHTGLYPPSAFIYRFGLIAGSAFISLLWLILSHYLASLNLPFLSAKVLPYLGILGAFALSLGECWIDPNVSLSTHVILMQVFSITTGVSVFGTTYFLQKNRATGQKVRIFCLLMALILLGLNPFDFNGNAIEWWAATLVIIWFLSFYTVFSKYSLSVSPNFA